MGVLDAEFLCARELLAGVYLSDSREDHCTLEVRILLILAHLNISPLSLCTEH